MNPPGLLRLRLFVSRHRRPVIAVLVTVALLATAGAGWVYANPGTETDTVQRYEQRVAGEVDTRAVVTGETSLYERGTELRNRRVYLQSASPDLTLVATASVPANATVHQRLVVRYRATRNGDVVWRQREVLAAGGADLRTTMNATRVNERLSAVRGEFGQAATASAQLGYVATYETDRYEGSLNASVPLGFTQNAYIVDGRLAAERDHSTATSVTTRQSPNVPLVGGLALVGLVAGAAAAVLVRNPPSVATTTDELQRRRYAEWISSGRLPVYAADRYVEMSTLADLVNVAVDSNRRVIHDGELDAYGIIDEDALYWYARGDDDLLGLAVPFEGAGEGRGARGARMGIEGFEGAEADAEGDADVPPGFERLEAGDDGGSAEGDDGNDDPEDLFDDL